jgi:hypothetical protein
MRYSRLLKSWLETFFRKTLREGLQPNVVTFNTVIRAQTESNVHTVREIDRAIIVYKILRSQTDKRIVF